MFRALLIVGAFAPLFAFASERIDVEQFFKENAQIQSNQKLLKIHDLFKREFDQMHITEQFAYCFFDVGDTTENHGAVGVPRAGGVFCNDVLENIFKEYPELKTETDRRVNR